MNKKLLWIFVFLLLATPISAQLIYEQEIAIDLKVPCMNNGTYCSDSATCNITILNPNSTTLINNKEMTNNLAFHNYSLTETQTETLGEYEVTVMCQDGTIYGYSTFNYKITPTGEEPSTPQGILYAFLILITAIFLGISLFGLVKINGKNEYDLGGKLLKLNYNKYLKVFLFFISYLFGMLLSYLAWETSKNFLWLGFMSDMFRFIFMFLVALLVPIFFIVFIGMLMRWLLDIKINKLAQRGLKPR